MKSRTFLPIAIFLLILAPLRAEDLLPPVPEGLDGPPPLEGDEQLPSLQDFDKFLPGIDPTQTDLEPGPAKPEAALQAIEKALPTATPVIATPTPVKASVPPTPTVRPAVPTPTSVVVAPATEKVPMTSEKQKPASGSAPSGTTSAPSGAAPAGTLSGKPATAPGAAVPPAAASVAPSSGSLTDYFPVQTGMKWNYEYLKAGADGARKARVVECVDVQTFENGTLRASFTVTEASPVKVGYSIHNGSVQKTLVGSRTLDADFAFKFPKPGVPSAWTATGVDGTLKTCSASFGKAQVYEKTYPDCVVVKEKVGVQTLFTFYAKGIGLVALEVYGAGMKLDPARSYALTGGPSK